MRNQHTGELISAGTNVTQVIIIIMINNSNSYNALHPVNIYELAALYINDINLTMKKGTKSQDET